MLAPNDGKMSYFKKLLETHSPPQKTSQDYESPYNDKVLCGNWQENVSEYVRHIYPSTSEYRREYNQPTVSTVTRNQYYDNKIKGWGKDWHTISYQGLPEEFHSNFSTLYDLAYNGTCPKLVNKPPKRFSSAFVEYRPQQDMMLNFGSTVNYGLRQYKAQQWEEDKLTDIADALTTYQNMFIPQDILPRSKKERFHRRRIDEEITGKQPLCLDNPQVITINRKRRPHQILPSL